MRNLAALGMGAVVAASVGTVDVAAADTFAPGSLIIPMDTAYQDSGMLKAYGLVYALLRGGIPVRWVIRSGKSPQGTDFIASAEDIRTGATITDHGYRGGPFVIDLADAAAATPIITAWQAVNPTVTAHQATATFSGDVARLLVAAPRIALLVDGSQTIGTGYLNAAGIPDEQGNPWPISSPDLVTPEALAGATTTDHRDGALFDEDGDPVYCHLASMHWTVTSAEANPEVVAEVRAFLQNPMHFFAGCASVMAFENLASYGHLLTTTGFNVGPQPASVDSLGADRTLAQLDGSFATTGGSEPSYAIPAGGAYRDGGVVMLGTHGRPTGYGDVWMSGYLDGACPVTAPSCGGLGKVSYLGGHQYTVNLPISTNPRTQGVRLFLNSILDSDCAAADGVPWVAVTKTAPASTVSATVTFTLAYANSGPGVALDAVLTDSLPAGSTFVSATGGGTLAGGTVRWVLGNLGAAESGSVEFTVTLAAHGIYTNTASIAYAAGLTPFAASSNSTSTIYDEDRDGDGVVDALDICPDDPNPVQTLCCDVMSCGACGVVCSVANGQPACAAGTCAVAACDAGFSDCDGQYATGCETADASFATDPENCGGCGATCGYPNATARCDGGACAMGACDVGWVDLDLQAETGCEYACTKVAGDDASCDGLDDDCDGATDEAWPPSSCGVGACAAAAECVAGAIACTPGQPGVEGPAGAGACADGTDNDCDGLTDDADDDCALGADAAPGDAAGDDGGLADAGAGDAAAVTPDAGGLADAGGGASDGSVADGGHPPGADGGSDDTSGGCGCRAAHEPARVQVEPALVLLACGLLGLGRRRRRSASPSGAAAPGQPGGRRMPGVP